MSDAADEELWLGLKWMKQICSMRVVEGEYDEMLDHSVATGRAWCHREGLVHEIVCSGITRIRILSTCHGEGGLYRISAASISSNRCLGKTETTVSNGHVQIELVVMENCTLQLKICDSGRDSRGWAGFCGPVLPASVTVIWNSTTLESCGVSSVYQNVVPITAPRVSFFCVGHGSKFMTDGSIFSERPWANMALQSRLPNLCHTQEFLMTFSTDEAFSFGSSLRILCRSPRVKIPIYLLESRPQARISVVLKGDVKHAILLVNDEMLSQSSTKTLPDGWMECHYEPPASYGVLSVSFVGNKSEIYIGKISIVGPVEPIVLPVTQVTRSFSSRSKSKHLVSWTLKTLDQFSVLDVLRNSKLIARLLPSLEGSFFDEEEQFDKDEIFYQIRLQ